MLKINPLNIRKKIALILLGIIGVIIFTKGLDLLMGFYMKDHLVETLFPPFARVHYQSSEFDTHDKISSQGLRNEEVTIPKPKNTIRILAVGDSYTYGWGIKSNQSWPKQLEKELQDKFPDKKVEVINAGAPGASPHRYVKTCSLYVHILQPDYVLWGLSYEDFNQLGARATGQTQQGGIEGFLADFYPHLYGGLTRYDFYQTAASGKELETKNVWKYQADRLAKQWGILRVARMDGDVRKMFLAGLLNPAYVQLAQLEPDFFQIALNKSDRAVTLSQLDLELSRATKACSGKNTRFIGTVFLPASVFFNQQGYQQKLGFTTTPLMLTTTRLFDRTKEILSKYHLNFFSPLEGLRKADCGDCYFHFDGHMNENGYKIVVSDIAPKVEKLIKSYENR